MLTPEAKQILLNYFQKYPDVLTHEASASGINPIILPDTFMQYELLTEPEHFKILTMTRKNNGIIDAEIINKWIEQNFLERKNGWQKEEGLTGEKIKLTKGARETLLGYMFLYPRVHKFESLEHHVDPVLFPDQFFRVEVLTESEHVSIVHLLEESGGIATKSIVNAWIEENKKNPKIFEK